MEKKVPLRKCVVSLERLPKKELIRVVRNTDNHIEIDLTGRANGRGAYLKKDKNVILKAKKTNVLSRHLEVEIPSNIYDELLKLVENEG